MINIFFGFLMFSIGVMLILMVIGSIQMTEYHKKAMESLKIWKKQMEEEENGNKNK